MSRPTLMTHLPPGISPMVLALSLIAPAAHAQLRPSPRAIDFGSRGHNEKLSDTIQLENIGAGPVTIKEIKASCSCISHDTSLVGATIPPGGAVELTIGMGSGRAMGILEKHVEILTADPAGQRLVVPVRMRVLDGFWVEPRELRFDGVVGGVPVTHSLEVRVSPGTPRRPFPLKVGGVIDERIRPQGPSPHFTSKVSDTPDGKRIEVTLLPTQPEGRIWAMSLEATLAGKTLAIPIAGEMFRGIKVVPTYFNFNRVEKENAASYFQKSTLTSTDGKPFSILEMSATFSQKSAPDAHIDLEVSGDTAGKPALEHVLRASIYPGAPFPIQKSFSGKVLIKTDHPEKHEVTLTFMGFCAEPLPQATRGGVRR